MAACLSSMTNSMSGTHLSTTCTASLQCTHASNLHEHGGLRRSSESQAALQAALMTSKMDALALEFNHLLVSQLDSQRHYYEGMPGCATSPLHPADKVLAARCCGTTGIFITLRLSAS